MYSIIDASAVEEKISDVIQKLVARHGHNAYQGVKLCQHGENKIILFEVFLQKESVVRLIHCFAERYSLYPAYMFDAKVKDSLLEKSAYKSYVVDQAMMTFALNGKSFEDWKKEAVLLMKKIYREDSVFLKIFVCEHEEVLYVAAYNSERDPKYQGEVIGVSGWKDAVVKFAKELEGSFEFRQARYANL